MFSCHVGLSPLFEATLKYFKCAFTVFIVVCIRMDLTEKEEEDPYAHSLIFQEILIERPVYLCDMLSPVSNI